MPAEVGDAVLVEWEDPYGCSSTWQDIPGNGEEPHVLRCRSIGWISATTPAIKPGMTFDMPTVLVDPRCAYNT